MNQKKEGWKTWNDKFDGNELGNNERDDTVYRMVTPIIHVKSYKNPKTIWTNS